MIVREDIKKLLSAGKNKEEVETVGELDNKTQIQDYYSNLANDIDKFDDLAWKSKTGYDTPHFPSFTKNLEGWSPGFYTFAGAANHGKTAMLLNILEDLCMTEENKLFGIFFSLDDSKNKVIPRVVAMRETIPISAVAKPARYKQMIDNGHEDTLLFNEYLTKRKEGLESLKADSNKMVIFDSTEIKTFTQLYDTIKNVYMYVKSQDEDANIVVAIDSLKDVVLDDIKLDASERIAEVARRIKDISIEFNCIVLSSMHLRKLNATRRPTLDDLREANTLEYELDACFLVYNDVSKNKQSAKIFRYEDEHDIEKKPVLEVDWAKNKISSYKGVTFCNFSPGYNKCTEVSEVAAEQYTIKLYSL